MDTKNPEGRNPNEWQRSTEKNFIKTLTLLFPLDIMRLDKGNTL